MSISRYNAYPFAPQEMRTVTAKTSYCASFYAVWAHFVPTESGGVSDGVFRCVQKFRNPTGNPVGGTYVSGYVTQQIKSFSTCRYPSQKNFPGNPPGLYNPGSRAQSYHERVIEMPFRPHTLAVQVKLIVCDETKLQP